VLFEGKSFQEIVSIIYTEIRAIAFALEANVDNSPVIVLNPSDYKVKNISTRNFFVYLICEDKSKADIIQNLEISKESKAKYFPEKQAHLNTKTKIETDVSF